MAFSTGEPHVNICSGLEGIAKFHKIVSPSAPVISLFDRGNSDAEDVSFLERLDNAVDPVELDDMAEDGMWYDASITSPLW